MLIEINTPGGLVTSTRDIIEKILASPLPVVIYVTPSGSRAASAGFFILESADVAAMAPGTNTGAAHPVTLGGEKMDEVMKQKMENDAAALMRSVADKRGRNVQVAESAVRESKSFTDQEALSQKLIDYVASSEEDLFRQMEGKTIKRFDGKTVTLNLSGKPVTLLEMTLKQRILAYIMDPNVAFILLAIGMLALYMEFNHPGAVLPGTVGVVFLSAGCIRAQSASDPLRSHRNDFGRLRSVRTRGQVHLARSPDDRRHYSTDARRADVG